MDGSRMDETVGRIEVILEEHREKLTAEERATLYDAKLILEALAGRLPS